MNRRRLNRIAKWATAGIAGLLGIGFLRGRTEQQPMEVERGMPASTVMVPRQTRSFRVVSEKEIRRNREERERIERESSEFWAEIKGQENAERKIAEIMRELRLQRQGEFEVERGKSYADFVEEMIRQRKGESRISEEGRKGREDVGAKKEKVPAMKEKKEKKKTWKQKIDEVKRSVVFRADTLEDVKKHYSNADFNNPPNGWRFMFAQEGKNVRIASGPTKGNYRVMTVTWKHEETGIRKELLVWIERK